MRLSAFLPDFFLSKEKLLRFEPDSKLHCMKALVLAASTLLFFTTGSLAQNLPPDYYWEVGANYGPSFMTRPSGPANAYQGTRTMHTHDYSVRLNYYFSPKWMINLDLGDRNWTSYGDWQVNDQLGQQLKTREITFVQAQHAFNESVSMNYVIPFYTRYNTYNKSNLYFGVSFGLMQTINDNSLSYSKYGAAPDSNLVYLSSYHYAAGAGYTAGMQIGYTWYLFPRLGFNVDLAIRYAHIKNNDTHYGSENSKYELLYFPETIGIRWRF
jgi:hypothetical protein